MFVVFVFKYDNLNRLKAVRTTTIFLGAHTIQAGNICYVKDKKASPVCISEIYIFAGSVSAEHLHSILERTLYSLSASSVIPSSSSLVNLFSGH
jgi:hypothetical protein